MKTPDFGMLYSDHVAATQQGYAKALENACLDAVIIHSGEPQRQRPVDDQYWPLRVTPTFAHWIPLVEASCYLVVTGATQPKLIRTQASDYWHSPTDELPDWVWPHFDTVRCEPQHLCDHLPRGRIAFVGSTAWAGQQVGIGTDRFEPDDLMTALHELRSYKTDYEIACIRAASARAARGHTDTAARFSTSPCSELELQLHYLACTQQRDHDTPYQSIVAMGPNAAVLHHTCYQTRAVVGESSLLVDAGAQCFGYAADITRTHVRGAGAAAHTFLALIRRLEKLQLQIIEEISLGLAFQDLHDHCHQLLAPLLRDVGVARGSDEELVENGTTRAFFPHGLGHSLGLQVHDVGLFPVAPEPRNPFLRNTGIVANGQVFTIEPGCYFIPALLGPLRGGSGGVTIDWATVDALTPFGGVRIEDNIFVREGLPVNLTRDEWPQ